MSGDDEYWSRNMEYLDKKVGTFSGGNPSGDYEALERRFTKLKLLVRKLIDGEDTCSALERFRLVERIERELRR